MKNKTKFCKDCFYCETPSDTESNCLHPRSRYTKSVAWTDIVTGEEKGETVYGYRSCDFMRFGYNDPGICNSRAYLFKHRDEMTEQALAEKKLNLSDRIKNFFA
jgi:hypothetical protein